MKHFFKTFAAVVLGIFAGGFILLIGAVAFVSFMVGSLNSEPSYEAAPNTILKIDLNGREREYINANPFAALLGEKQKDLSLQKQLQAIRTAKMDRNISGIYLNAKSWVTGIASAQALRRTLQDFKESGKFVIAYADQYTQAAYYLCSVADRVIVNPQGSIDLHGLYAERNFYTGLMQKLGITAQIFKVGTYKSAVEPFMRTDMSEANKLQTSLYLNDQWDYILSEIGESRSVSPQTLNGEVNNILSLNETSYYEEIGLADSLLYRSDMEKLLIEMTGVSSKKDLKIASVDEVCSIKPVQSGKVSDKIAVLYAEGEITEAAMNRDIYDTEPSITSRYLKEIQDLKDDESVKAVVMRVNSPGGSAFLSEQIWKELNDLKAVKPFIVSMGDVAASGGYYISAGANLIVAEPTTITGSIGIFGIIPDFSGLLGKTGITFDEVQTNKHANFPSVIQPMDETEKQSMQAYVERGYRLFLKRCSEGRRMPLDSMAKIAEGRVWSGVRAMELGLVDELGDLDKAIQLAADYAQINEYETVNYPKQKDFFSLLMKNGPTQITTSFFYRFSSNDMRDLLFIYRLKDIEKIQARLPFEMNTSL